MSTVPAAKLVEPGQGMTIMLYAVRFDYRVTSADAGGALSSLEVTIPPGTLVKPHNHSRQDEFTVVLAGTVGARAGRIRRPRRTLRPHHPERLDRGAGADLQGQALTAAAGSRPSTPARNWPV